MLQCLNIFISATPFTPHNPTLTHPSCLGHNPQASPPQNGAFQPHTLSVSL